MAVFEQVRFKNGETHSYTAAQLQEKFGLVADQVKGGITVEHKTHGLGTVVVHAHARARVLCARARTHRRTDARTHVERMHARTHAPRVHACMRVCGHAHMNWYMHSCTCRNAHIYTRMNRLMYAWTQTRTGI